MHKAEAAIVAATATEEMTVKKEEMLTDDDVAPLRVYLYASS